MSQPVSVPHELGGYHLIRRIASSAMSTVFLARLARREVGAQVFAIKLLSLRHDEQDEERLRRFELEANLSAAIEHPNMVKALDYGVENHQPYIVMEHLEGASLAKVIEVSTSSDTLPPAVYAHLCARAAEGLHALHELKRPQELVHRDVSPQNIFVTIAGDVKLLDLGLVRPAGPPPQMELDGALAGTYPYLAPERVERRNADRRSDLFSLGVILYEAATLTRLFKAPNDAKTLENIRQYRIRPIHRIVPGIPRRLEGVIMRALRHEPSGRYATAAELAVDLDRFVSSTEGGAWAQEELVAVTSERIMSLVDTAVSVDAM